MSERQRFRVHAEGPEGQRFIGQSDDFSEAVALADASYAQIWDDKEQAWLAPDDPPDPSPEDKT